MEYEVIRTQRVFEEVTKQLRAQIEASDLAPGDKLPNERDLARAFGVSRHAIREAFRSLEVTGWIELRKGSTGGAFVARGRAEAVNDVMLRMFQAGAISLVELTEARLWIETAIIAAACGKVDQAGLERLSQNTDAAEQATLAGESRKKTELNIEFHLLLAEITENPILIIMMSSLMNILSAFVEKLGSVMSDDVIDSRRRFLHHLGARDVDRAIEEMQNHLRILHRHYENAETLIRQRDGTQNA